MLSRLRNDQSATIYDTIGGYSALEVVVEDFYARVLDDEQLARFFTAANMSHLKDRQVAFFAALLGGPTPYTGASMRRAHRGRGITMHHFDLLTGHLADSLAAAGASAGTVAEVLAALAPLAGDIASDDAASARL